MAEKIVLATHNAGKIREFKSILEPLGYEAVSVHDVLPSITEPEETGTTFAENALLKASYYMKATGLPCLADDSGIAADALGAVGNAHRLCRLGRHRRHYAHRLPRLHRSRCFGADSDVRL